MRQRNGKPVHGKGEPGARPRRWFRRSAIVILVAWAVLATAVPTAGALNQIVQTRAADAATAQALADFEAEILAELEAAMAQAVADTDGSIPPAPPVASGIQFGAPAGRPVTAAVPQLQSQRCSGAEINDLGAAQDSYTARCNQEYDPSSGFHRCDYLTVGFVCSGPVGTPGTEPPGGPGGGGGPPTGGPSGLGPLVPQNLQAVPVTFDQTAVNPDGIRVSWEAGGGPESIGFNINRKVAGEPGPREYLISIIGREFFVDCEVTRGVTYEYTVSAWSEGPEFSYTTLPTTATAGVTPRECRSLVPPGPSGENEPSEDELFTLNARNTEEKPATPERVQVVGTGAAARLRWEMPASARMVFQITRNGLTEDESDDRWGQFQVTPGHQDMTFGSRGADGGSWMEFPVGQFSPGDNFVLQATHPWTVPDEELGPNARFSEQSRFATMINPGAGTTIRNFYAVLGTDQAPEGSWIGGQSNWKPIPQFSDDFNAVADPNAVLELNDVSDDWYFARTVGERELTPDPNRLPGQTDDRAILRNGRLEMSAGIDDGAYTYMATANDEGEGYFVDPTNGVFVEASVRLDQMSPANNAWWAFWLMAPGVSACDANGDPVPGAQAAYDGHPSTGVELDMFEFVPDLQNGFNTALYRYEFGQGGNCPDPGEPYGLSPDDRNFTYEGVRSLPGVDMPNYMDGNYHRLGLYYAQDCYVVYLDDEMIWMITEESHPGWITKAPKNSIRMTWEIQDTPFVWTERGGQFAETALNDRDPTVFIDYVNVWEKKESANGLCSGGDDPEPEGPGGPGADLPEPKWVTADASPREILVRWRAGDGPAPDGWDIRRNDVGYWSITDGNASSFVDTGTVDGQTYTYEVTPWLDAPSLDPEDRSYGPRSESATATAEDGVVGEPRHPELPTNVQAFADPRSVRLTWQPPTVEPVGYNINRDGEYYRTIFPGSFPDGSAPEFTDDAVFAGAIYSYSVSAFFGNLANRTYSSQSDEITVEVPDGPGALRSLYATTRNDSVTLRWTPTYFTDGFVIEKDTGSERGFYDSVLADDLEGTWESVSSVEWTDPEPLTENATYTVYAFDGDGEDRITGPFKSVTASLDLTGEPEVGKVYDFGIKGGNLRASFVTLVWSAVPENIDYFIVKRNGEELFQMQGWSDLATDLTVGDLRGAIEYSITPYLQLPDETVLVGFGDGPFRLPIFETIPGALLAGDETRITVLRSDDGQTTVLNNAPVTDVRVDQTPYRAEVIVSWTPPAGRPKPTGYDIDRNGDYLTSTTGTTFHDDTVLFGRLYAYTIRPVYDVFGSNRIGPKQSSPSQFVFWPPGTVTPYPSTGVDLALVGDDIEVSWYAPQGWEEGYITAYEIHRNGEVIATVDEESFGSELATARRTFLDTDVRSFFVRPWMYSVVAIGNQGQVGVRSKPAFILAGEGERAGEREVPLVYLRAVQEILEAPSQDEDELAAELYALSLLQPSAINNAAGLDDFFPLLKKFNDSLIGIGKPQYALSDQQLIDLRNFESATRIVDNIAASSDRTLTSIISRSRIGGESDINVVFGSLRSQSDWNLETRVDYIRQQTELLDEALEANNLAGVQNTAARISLVAIGNEPRESRAASILRAVEFSEFPRGLLPLGSPVTPLQVLWNDASPDERLEYLGITRAEYDFARPFIDLADEAAAAIVAADRARSKAKTRGYLAVIIAVAASIITPQLSGFWVRAAFAGFAALTASLVAGAPLEEALEDGARAFVTAGLNYYQNLADPNWWQLLAWASLSAALQRNSQDRYSTFLSVLGQDYVTNGWGEAAWIKVQPYLNVVIDMAVAAALGSDEDLEKFSEQFEQLLYNLVGNEFAAFVADKLPEAWGDTGDALADLAGYAVRVAGDEEKIRNYFFEETLKVLAQTIGNELVDFFGGKDEFLRLIIGDLVLIGSRTFLQDELGQDYDETAAFEKMVYGHAATYLSSKVNARLVAANNGRTEGAAARAIAGLTRLLDTSVRFSYDPAARQREMHNAAEEWLIEEFVEFLPDCGREEIRTLTRNITSTLVDSSKTGDYEANAESLIRNGIYLGVEINQNCDGAEDETETPLSGEFKDMLIAMTESQIDQFMSFGDSIPLIATVEGYPADRLAISGSLGFLQAGIVGLDSWSGTGELLTVDRVDDKIVGFSDYIEGDPCRVDGQSTVNADQLLVEAGFGSSVRAQHGLRALAQNDPNCPVGPATPNEFARFMIDLDPADIRAGGIATYLHTNGNRHATLAGAFSSESRFSELRFEYPPNRNGDVIAMVATAPIGLNPNWRVTGISAMIRFEGGEIIDVWDPNFTDSGFGGRLANIEPHEITNLLISDTITQNGESFEIYTPPLSLDGAPATIRIKIPTGAELGEIEKRSLVGAGWLPTKEFYEVERSGGGAPTGFRRASSTRVGQLGTAFARLLVSNFDIGTPAQELTELWAMARGCYTSVAEAVDEVLQFLDAPIRAIVNLIKAVPDIIALLLHNPGLFLTSVLEDVMRVDEFNAIDRTQDDASLEESRWKGAVLCDVILAFLVPPGVRYVTKVIVSPEIARDLVKRTNNGEFNNLRRSGCSSFPTGTPVLMADGSHRAIDQIRPGDEVVSFDIDVGVWRTRQVLDQWSYLDDGELATVTLEDGTDVTATDHHLFWVESRQEWVELEHVLPGDRLLAPIGTVEVSDLTIRGPPGTLVWELTVEDDHNFTVSTGSTDLLVHNGDCLLETDPRIVDALHDSSGGRSMANLGLEASDIASAFFRYPGPMTFEEWIVLYQRITRNRDAGRQFENAVLARNGVIKNIHLFDADGANPFIPDGVRPERAVDEDVTEFIEAKNVQSLNAGVNSNFAHMLRWAILNRANTGFRITLERQPGSTFTGPLLDLMARARESGITVEVIPPE